MGSGSRELEGKEISSELDAVIAGRECRLISRSSRENIPIIVDDSDSFERKMIQPVLCASDAIGAVILLSRSEKAEMGDTERALVRTAAGFLGRQYGAVNVHQMYRKMCEDQDINIRCRCQEAADQGGCGHREGKLWYSSRVRFVMVSQEARGLVT